MGVEGIRQKIADHISWARELAGQIGASPGFKLYTPQNLALVCFAIIPGGPENVDRKNQKNLDFLHHLNSSGKVYLSHTKVDGRVFLRMQIGQTSVTREHVQKAWRFIQEEAIKFM
jgi:aromatic-L-amino-acid/L-tryptophan decarboxylase